MPTRTKDVIVKTLRAKGRCTVKELAEAAQVSPVSVRHHLASLQAEGLVDMEEVRHGVGRPRHHYFLTDQAHELFPTRYFRLTNRILEEIKDSLPEIKVQELLSSVADSLAEQFASELVGLSLEERLARLEAFLTEEGFEVEIERSGDTVILHELSCPYFRVGQSHPEICTIDQTLIARALNVPVERVTCLLDGDAHCKYAVQLDTTLDTPMEEAKAHE
jgi:predicted ArsR family transcriptional regulator